MWRSHVMCLMNTGSRLRCQHQTANGLFAESTVRSIKPCRMTAPARCMPVSTGIASARRRRKVPAICRQVPLPGKWLISRSTVDYPRELVMKIRIPRRCAGLCLLLVAIAPAWATEPDNMMKMSTTVHMQMAGMPAMLTTIITIMVLELKVPVGHSLASVLLSYVLSFVYVGIYWNNHHHMLATSHQPPATSHRISDFGFRMARCGPTCTCCSGCRCFRSPRHGWARTTSPLCRRRSTGPCC